MYKNLEESFLTFTQIRKQPEQQGCHNLTPRCDISQAGVSVTVVSLNIYKDAVYLSSCESISN